MARFFARLLLLLLCVLAPSAFALAGKLPDGFWFTPDKGGVVQISACGTNLCGVIVGLTPTPQGKLPRDYEGGPQCRFPLLQKLRLQDDGRWHGTVTNPEDGKVYDAEIWVAEDGNLRLHGYLGVPILGETQTWPPFNGRLGSDCRFH